MIKFYITDIRLNILFVILVFLGGCTGDGELVSEIKALKKPVNFEEIDIYSVLERHIDVGLAEKTVADILIAEGFRLYRDEPGSTVSNTKKTYWVRYLGKSFSAPARYRVNIKIDIENEKVSAYSGVYLRHK